MQRTCRKSKQKWSFWSGQSWRRLQRHRKVESARWGGDHVPTKLMVPSYLAWALLWGPKSNCWWGEAEERQSQGKKTFPPQKAPGGNSPLTALRGPAPQPYYQSTNCPGQDAQISYPVTKHNSRGNLGLLGRLALYGLELPGASLSKERRSSSGS